MSHAQQLTLNQTQYERTPEVSRNDATLNRAISRADCEAAGNYKFYLTRTGSAATTLRVFVGNTNDCSVFDNRTKEKGCIEIFSRADDSTHYEIDLDFKDIIAGRRAGSSQCAAFDAECKAAACEDVDSGARKTLKLWFTLDSSSDTAVSSATWDTSYDLAGPNPPTNISLGVGEEQLKVSWKTVNSSDLARYHFYCEQSTNSTAESLVPFAPDGGAGAGGSTAGAAGAGGSTAGAAGAGTGGGANTAGASSGGTTGNTASGNCNAQNLKPGSLPNAQLQCGSANTSTATSGIVSGLNNFTEYTIGVAAVDDLGNPGPLSALACGTPEPVDDFFEQYRRAGGEGGGGYCSISHTETQHLASFFALVGAAWLLRRKRSERTNAPHS